MCGLRVTTYLPSYWEFSGGALSLSASWASSGREESRSEHNSQLRRAPAEASLLLLAAKQIPFTYLHPVQASGRAAALSSLCTTTPPRTHGQAIYNSSTEADAASLTSDNFGLVTQVSGNRWRYCNAKMLVDMLQQGRLQARAGNFYDIASSGTSSESDGRILTLHAAAAA